MIISKTPVRISFFGGGTDYPDHYRTHGGEVLSTSIDKYVYITVSPRGKLFEHPIRVAYSRTELVHDVGDIQHPSVRACLRHAGIDEGIEISVVADLPARTGLGSSSAFTVGLLHCLHAWKGETVTRETLAEEARHVEQEIICEKVGSQDQVATAIGGFNRVTFQRDPEFNAVPLQLADSRREELNRHLMLFYTGISRYAEDVLDEQCSKVSENHPSLTRMRAQVQQGVEVLCNEAAPLSAFGDLLDETWRLKRGLSSKISNATVDGAYDRARIAGAIGGKLLGAGSGGFLLLFADPDRHSDIERSLPDLTRVQVGFDTGGTQIVYTCDQ